jgi:CDI immunity proteins
LVTTIHRSSRKPLDEFTAEDLRIMIGQNIGLNYLLPLAIEHLEENPLASGDFYRGDLLKNVLSIDLHFWREYPDLWWKVQEIVGEVESTKKTIDDEIRPAAEVFRRGKKE